MSERNDPDAKPEGADAASTDPTGTNVTDTNATNTEPSFQEHHNPETDEDTASGGSPGA
jgi:hypothetical protein